MGIVTTRWVRPEEIKTHATLSLFPIGETELTSITRSMQEHGYDPSQPIVVWEEEGYIVDGHTRRQAACAAQVECAVMELSFADWDQALDYAIARQRDRRNLSLEELSSFIAHSVQSKDKLKPRGGDHTSDGAKASRDAFAPGKSAADLARQLSSPTVLVSQATVERVRHVLNSEDEEIKEKLLAGKIRPKTAYVQVEERKAQRANPPRAAYSIEQWATVPGAERAAIIEHGRASNLSLNQQDTDNIEWAKWSWNPVTGCLHNCPYCYARDIANAPAPRGYVEGFAPTFRPDRLSAPFRQHVPAKAQSELGFRNIFTCSMADLFGKWVPADWIEAVLDVVRECPEWNFLFLTKFPNRLAEFTYPKNAWLGTTVDCQARVKNAERSFEKVQGAVKWLSVEPLLEPLHFDSLEMFDWMVIGGASSSSQTPEWHPPRRWVDTLEAAARDAGCMIYEKTNLQARLREYPGWERQEQTLPPTLAYLPSIG